MGGEVGRRGFVGCVSTSLAVLALAATTACSGSSSGDGSASTPSTSRSGGPPSVAATAGLLPAGFPAHSMSYDLKTPFAAANGTTVFPGHYALTVSRDGSAVISTADGHDVAVVIHAVGADRVQLYQEGGAPSLGNFHWALTGSTLTFSDDRPGLETSFDRYLLASPFTVGTT